MTRRAARALNNKKNIMLTVRSIAEHIAESIAFTYISETNGITQKSMSVGMAQTILRQSWRDPGIGILPIPNPGIEKSTPGLQSLLARLSPVQPA